MQDLVIALRRAHTAPERRRRDGRATSEAIARSGPAVLFDSPMTTVTLEAPPTITVGPDEPRACWTKRLLIDNPAVALTNL
ncbi:hypothetical protein LA080_012525 [Diaporthe eres]|nr:hypothetical protein LA080_012525 [Diaporthe eres]